MIDEYELDHAQSERDDAIRNAAKLANALQDIYNEIGEMPEVKKTYKSVERLVSQYSGLHNFGETQ